MTKTKKKGGYGSFRSDTAAEQEGVELDYGPFRVTAGRSSSRPSTRRSPNGS